eukprot:TRINITY_DN9497_c0_g1_i2.p1 TRINITY_DN9497_c0_g1~~TRINITY_DN9497_c0_g1_i2.p1  ORF type:complete len:715 (+),score=125.62 TRINITY_DN9497_c0_g1_i2:235-2145(+)
MPWFASSFPFLSERALEVTVFGSYLFVSSTDGVKIMSVVNPLSPSQLSEVPLDGPTSSCLSKDNKFIFIAFAAGSIRVMDLDFVDSPGQTIDITIPVTMNLPVGSRLTCTEQLLFFSAGSRGTFLIDIRNPATMNASSVLSAYTIDVFTNMVATNGDGLIYLAKDTGVGFYNASSPDEAPLHLYNAPGGGQVAWLKYANGELSLADATPTDGGLHTVYLTNNKITASSQTGAAFCVDVFGNVGVVAMGDGGLDVYDVTPGPSPPPSIVTPNPPPPTPVPTLAPVTPTPTPTITVTQTMSITLLPGASSTANPTPQPPIVPSTPSPTATPLPPGVTAAPTLTPTAVPLPPGVTASPTAVPLPPGVTASPTAVPLPPGVTASPTASPASTPVPDIVTKFTSLSGCNAWSVSTDNSMGSVEMIPGTYEGKNAFEITVFRTSIAISWLALGVEIEGTNGTFDLIVVMIDPANAVWTVRDASQSSQMLIASDSQEGIYYDTVVNSSANSITFFKECITSEVTGDATAVDANITSLSGRSILLSAGTVGESAAVNPTKRIPYDGCSVAAPPPPSDNDDDEGLSTLATVLLIVGPVLLVAFIAGFWFFRSSNQKEPTVNFSDAVELLESHHQSVQGPKKLSPR